MPNRSRGWKFWARRGFEVALVAAAAVFVVRRVHRLATVGSLFVHVRWEWLLAGAAAEALSVLALSFLQQKVIVSSGTRVSLPTMVPVTLAANAVALSIPAGVVVAEGYVFKQYRRVGMTQVAAAWAELSSGAIAAAALAAVAFAGALLVGGNVRTLLVGPLAVVVVGACLAAFLFQRTALLSTVARSVVAFAERHAPDGIRARLRRAEKASAQMVDLEPDGFLVGLGASAAVANWLLDAGVLAAGLLAVGERVPWSALLLVYAGGQLLAEMPFTPGGLGVVEGGMVTMLTRFHVPVPQATASVLVYRGLSFWLLIAVGWVAAARLRFAD